MLQEGYMANVPIFQSLGIPYKLFSQWAPGETFPVEEVGMFVGRPATKQRCR